MARVALERNDNDWASSSELKRVNLKLKRVNLELLFIRWLESLEKAGWN